MRKYLALTALLILVTVPLVAGNRSCNTTLVGQGVCRQSTYTVLFYDAPSSALIDLRDTMLAEGNYQDEIICVAGARQYAQLSNGQPSRVLNAASASTDSCTAGQPTTNPQGTTEFADAWIDKLLRDKVINYKFNVAQQQAGDITEIGSPDVGGEP